MANKVELLAPAGNQEKLKIAILYGADAVYIGIDGYSLRGSAGSFKLGDLPAAVTFAHRHEVKAYIALNIFAHNQDFDSLPEILRVVAKSKADAIIVSDPGIFYQVRHILPRLPVHISTQANTTNRYAAEFWRDQGAKRVTLARELSLPEISLIAGRSGLETEVFVHGAMCISYSGRCFLSKYLAGRDANLGDCAHSCRWKYHLMEEKRSGEFLPVFEDRRGSYIFNSKDLRLAAFIPDLIKAGVSSFKIEGRMKSLHYVATVVRVYRSIVDNYYKLGKDFSFKREWLYELEKVSHRRYSTGFLDGESELEANENSTYIRRYDFVGLVEECRLNSGRLLVGVRNRLRIGDELEALMPNGNIMSFKLETIILGGEDVLEAHANDKIEIITNKPVMAGSILRRSNTSIKETDMN